MNTNAFLNGFIKVGVSAEAFRLLKPALRMAQGQGANIRRVQPHNPAALLKPWHSKLPTDPYLSNVSGNQISIAKGINRNIIPGGVNAPISSAAHELGHFTHDKQFGQFRPRPAQGFLPENSAVRAIESPIRELQANNTVMQYLKQMKASPEATDWYLKTRGGSYNQHLHSAYAKINNSNPATITDTIKAIWRKLVEATKTSGTTRTFSTKQDIPEAFGNLLSK